MKKRLILKLEGRVQRVGFRIYAQKEAERLNLTGYIKNENDGSLSILIEGEEEKIKEFTEWTKSGPRGAWVKKMFFKWAKYTQEFTKFEIRY